VTAAGSLPAPCAVEVPHAAGLTHGVAWRWPDSDLAVLALHDVGSDLDAVRWICEPLATAGADVLSIDLPGHGLSDGNIRSAAGPAITAAWDQLSADPARAACLLAEGRTVELVLKMDLPSPPAGAVLLAPARRPGASSAPADSWACVPKLVIAPAGADASTAYADDIVGRTRAWCLRADLARSGGDDLQQPFMVQVASLALKFLLEQAVFELAHRQARRADGPD
jgi:pimeloyl-ACP methyl ester carboxylesterase